MNVTDQQADKIRKLWGAGLSALQCAEEAGLTGDPTEIRNAVMLAIESAPRAVAKVQKPKAGNKRPKSSHSFNPQNSEPKVVVPFVETTPEDDLAIPREQRKSLLEITDKHCHWPVGDPRDPAFFFCGDAAAEGEVYCRSHCARAYNGIPSHHRKAA